MYAESFPTLKACLHHNQEEKVRILGSTSRTLRTTSSLTTQQATTYSLLSLWQELKDTVSQRGNVSVHHHTTRTAHPLGQRLQWLLNPQVPISMSLSLGRLLPGSHLVSAIFLAGSYFGN